MQDFNQAILSELIAQGCRYILYYSMKHFALIVPQKHTCETNHCSFLVPINDELVTEMADGIDEFSIYVFS